MKNNQTRFNKNQVYRSFGLCHTPRGLPSSACAKGNIAGEAGETIPGTWAGAKANEVREKRRNSGIPTTLLFFV